MQHLGNPRVVFPFKPIVVGDGHQRPTNTHDAQGRVLGVFYPKTRCLLAAGTSEHLDVSFSQGVVADYTPAQPSLYPTPRVTRQVKSLFEARTAQEPPSEGPKKGFCSQLPSTPTRHQLRAIPQAIDDQLFESLITVPSGYKTQPTRCLYSPHTILSPPSSLGSRTNTLTQLFLLSLHILFPHPPLEHDYLWA